MLLELSIANYALIDKLNLTLAPGFTVLTGETGAGKSIILDALGLLLGDRADGGMVRAGAERAVVEGIFEVGPEVEEAIGAIVDADVSVDGLMLRREVTAEGRSVCRVNGSAVPLRKLAEVGARLVDVHGQGEHLSLLRPAEQLNVLDRYAGLGRERAEFASLVRRLASVRRHRAAVRREQEELAARSELLRFQVDEISGAELRPGEEEGLISERNLRLNAEKAVLLAEEAVQALESEDPGQPGALDLLAAAGRSLSALERLAPALEAQRRTAESAALELREVASELRRFAGSLEHDPRRLDEIAERLDRIGALKRKYGATMEEVLAYADSAAQELDRQGRADVELAALEEEEGVLLRRAGQLASTLFGRRLDAACRLSSAVERELQALGMEAARLAVRFRHEESAEGLPVSGVFDVSVESSSAPERPENASSSLRFGPHGVDELEFFISANPGEPLRPLATTASGGETSRLMLAIKGALAEADPVPVLIFDEIDAGIGGRAGEVVGRRLWALGRSHQVLAVTHLPQIASCADRHVAVRKTVEEGRTRTRVTVVSDEERLREIGTMLGTESAATLAKAAELLQRRPG